jgi:hypothetical protein
VLEGTAVVRRFFNSSVVHFDNPSLSLYLYLSLSLSHRERELFAPLPVGVEGQDKRLKTVALRHPVTRVLPFR